MADNTKIYGDLFPNADGTLDIGSSSYKFKDMYLSGTANVNTLVEDTPTLLKLDQTTPQTITGGKPIFSSGLVAGTPAGSYLANVGGVNATDIVNSDNGYRTLLVTRPTFTSANLVLAAGGTNLDESAVYHYSVTFVTAVGETNIQSASANITTEAAGGKRKVTITVPTSTDYRVTARKIYRSVGGGGQFDNRLLTTINDNTTTEYLDDIADGSLGAASTNSYFRDNTTVKWLSGSSTFMTPGSNSTRFGISAGRDSASGGRNSFFGSSCFFNVSTGNDNVGVGGGVGYTCNPSACTALGQYAMGALQGDRSSITAVGYQSLFGSFADSTINPDYSVGVGQYSGAAGLGRYSVAVGYDAGRNTYNVNAYNTYVGYQSAKGAAGSNGTSNSSLGALSGNATTSGSNNLWLGANAGRYSTTESGEFFVNTYNLGTRALDVTDSLMYGVMKDNDPANQTLRINGAVTLGTTDARSHLAFQRAGYNYITCPSTGLFAFVPDGAAVSDANSAMVIYANKDVSVRGNPYLTSVKSGATQAGAGAAANEVWKTASHASLPDNVLMIGV